jgi:cell division transport system permease protein
VTRITTALSAWFGRHAQSALGTLGGLWRQPLGSLLTVAVIGIALALPAMLYVAANNSRSLAGNWQSARDFSVYLVPGQPLEAAEAVAAELRARDIVAEVDLITADEALAQLGARAGFGPAIEGMQGNPLPHTLLVRPLEIATPDDLTLIAGQLTENPVIDQVQVDTIWISRLDALLEYIRRAVLAGSVLLACAIVVVIGNTIRLDIQNRRVEIETQKLLGADNAFVRRPFLYTGFWYGLLGGVFALLLAGALSLATRGAAERIALLYDADFNLLSFDPAVALAMLGAGAVSGWLGAWWAVARHIAGIQPS